MARPKGKLLALVLVFGAITVVTATGAFTTVEAERTAEVNVSGDSAALLQITPNGSSANGDYAQINNGEFEILLDGSNTPDGDGDGQGINQNATTQMHHVFNVSNQGTQTVDVGVSISENSSINAGSSADSPNFYLYTGADDTRDLTTSTVSVDPGNKQSVGIYFDTRGLPQDQDISLTITIEANASNA